MRRIVRGIVFVLFLLLILWTCRWVYHNWLARWQEQQVMQPVPLGPAGRESP